MANATEPSDAFRQHGIAVIPAVVTDTSLLQRLMALPGFAAQAPGTRASAVSHDVAHLIGYGGCLGALACTLMRRPAWPVRVLYFDKSEAANWSVPWHQDRTIAVASRADVPGYAAWSIKDGTVHVEPAVDILLGMIALRLHLDACGSDNGALLAVRGSYRGGRVAARDIGKRVDAGDIATYAARSGDVIAMRGLTLHASRRSTAPRHRRVLHVDYATVDLPPPLAWAMTLPG